MNDLERQVRSALTQRAGVPGLRTMPEPTTRAVRRRQIGMSTVVLTCLAVAVLAGVSVLSAVGFRSDRETTSGAGEPDHVLERVPEGWPSVALLDRSDGFVNPDGLRARDEPRVVAYGRVDGELFSLSAWTRINGVACLGIAGPGGDDFASPAPQPPGAWGGLVAGTCALDQGVPDERDLYLVGWTGTPALTADTGFVSERVDRLMVVEPDDTQTTVPLLRGSAGWRELRTFVFFPPEGLEGTLVALDASGTELASTPICTYEGVSGGCAWPVEQLVPIDQPGTVGPDAAVQERIAVLRARFAALEDRLADVTDAQERRTIERRISEIDGELARLEP